MHSTWIRFKSNSAGTLTFVISPITPTDDIDFVLFKSTKGNCTSLQEVRCMASGRSYVQIESNQNV
jgi:hypothetical protein